MTDFKSVVRVLAEGGVEFIAELEALLEERRRAAES
jgi:hypothetical protein